VRSTPDSRLEASRIVRSAVGIATMVLLLVAFIVGENAGLFAAAVGCGAVWWAWDLLTAYVVRPLGCWMSQMILGGGLGIDDAGSRPKLDDLIRLLESHLAHSTSRQVDINAALRLAEIYRTVKKDPDRAQAVLEIVRARYPGAPELARHERASRQDVDARGTDAAV